MQYHDANKCKYVASRPDEMRIPEVNSINDHKHKDKNRYDDYCDIKRRTKGRRSIQNTEPCQKQEDEEIKVLNEEVAEFGA